MSSDDDDGPRMVVADDGEESSHDRRKRLLEDLREHAINVQLDVRSRQARGEITTQQARQEYRGAVRQYLRETFQILQRDDVTLSKDYLGNVELGVVTFEPPRELVALAEQHLGRLAPGEQVPTRVTKPIGGLRAVVDLPSPLTHTFTVAYRQGGSIRTQRRTVETELPEQVLDAAVEKADAALSEVELGMQVDAGQQVVKIDRDLLDEVDEWRQDNV
jgi:hypothetical protein